MNEGPRTNGLVRGGKVLAGDVEVDVPVRADVVDDVAGQRLRAVIEVIDDVDAVPVVLNLGQMPVLKDVEGLTWVDRGEGFHRFLRGLGVLGYFRNLGLGSGILQEARILLPAALADVV